MSDLQQKTEQAQNQEQTQQTSNQQPNNVINVINERPKNKWSRYRRICIGISRFIRKLYTYLRMDNMGIRSYTFICRNFQNS